MKMATNKHCRTREERIEDLKLACDSIKELADNFIGNEPFPLNWKISIIINAHEPPYITVERESIPHKYMDKLTMCD